MAEGRFVVSRIGRVLVVTLEGTADSTTLSAACDTFADMHAQEAADGVVLDVSGCEVIDLDEFAELEKLAQTMEWLGLRSVIAGLRPGIVAYLASAGTSAGSLRTSLDLGHALLQLNPPDDDTEPEPESEPEPKYEPDEAESL
jgi:rsbT antagonist protein RsbS